MMKKKKKKIEKCVITEEDINLNKYDELYKFSILAKLILITFIIMIPIEISKHLFFTSLIDITFVFMNIWFIYDNHKDMKKLEKQIKGEKNVKTNYNLRSNGK
jgi:hypothetical protein